MKLSITQKKVLDLITDKWQTSYSLGCSLATLNKLVKLGLIENKYALGCSFMPRSCIYFRKKQI